MASALTVFSENIVTMNIISRKTHGLLDYVMGVILIASPWLFGFYNGGIEAIVPIVLGLSAITYSLITDYESGLVDVISFSTHLILDLVSGLLLVASPWIFGFSEGVYIPHVALGMTILTVVLLTSRPENVQAVASKKVNKPKTSLR
jgi:hypothetical protein